MAQESFKAIERLKESVKQGGLKLTKQRETICEVFFAQQGHRRADEILNDARTQDKKVSLATVYRTLKLLQEYGFATAHNFQDGQALFEPSLDIHDHHDHLICTSCQRIIEFFNPEIEKLQTMIAAAHGFSVTNHKMELYGLCSECA